MKTNEPKAATIKMPIMIHGTMDSMDPAIRLARTAMVTIQPSSVGIGTKNSMIPSREGIKNSSQVEIENFFTNKSPFLSVLIHIIITDYTTLFPYESAPQPMFILSENIHKKYPLNKENIEGVIFRRILQNPHASDNYKSVLSSTSFRSLYRLAAACAPSRQASRQFARCALSWNSFSAHEHPEYRKRHPVGQASPVYCSQKRHNARSGGPSFGGLRGQPRGQLLHDLGGQHSPDRR